MLGAASARTSTSGRSSARTSASGPSSAVTPLVLSSAGTSAATATTSATTPATPPALTTTTNTVAATPTSRMLPATATVSATIAATVRAFDAPAVGRRRRDHAVQLPRDDTSVEARAGDRLWQRLHPQTLGAGPGRPTSAGGIVCRGGRRRREFFNVVNGDKEAVDAVLDDPLIRAIGFVGSTPIAHYIYSRGTANGKRVQCFGGARTIWW